MRIFAVASAVFLACIVSADAGSLFCDKGVYRSEDLKTVLGEIPYYTAVIDYQEHNVTIMTYYNGNLENRHNFESAQIRPLNKHNLYFNGNGKGDFIYDTYKNELATIGRMHTDNVRVWLLFTCH